MVKTLIKGESLFMKKWEILAAIGSLRAIARSKGIPAPTCVTIIFKPRSVIREELQGITFTGIAYFDFSSPATLFLSKELPRSKMIEAIIHEYAHMVRAYHGSYQHSNIAFEEEEAGRWEKLQPLVESVIEITRKPLDKRRLLEVLS